MKLTEAAEKFLSKALGQDGLEELQKFELFKFRSNKVLDHEEIRTALQIVPRTVLSLLQKELGSLKEGGNTEFKLPVEPDAFLSATKYENDVYTGEIRQDGKLVAKFKDRSLPGVGLVVMSAFELYDVAELPKAQEQPLAFQDMGQEIQRIIDERLGLRDLIGRVVDQKLSEREAIDSLIKLRLTQAMYEASDKKDSMPQKAPGKLKSFLEKKADKRSPEFKISMNKSEVVKCEDCHKDIFVEGAYSGCVCYGDDRNNKIFVKKTEGGFSMRFPKSWDAENIEMLLEALRKRNRGKL